MAYDGLEFEKPILELAQRIEELESFAKERGVDMEAEIQVLRTSKAALTKEIISKLTPMERVQLSRHPQRPYTLAYFDMIMDEFTELHGDRCFGDDKAIVGGLAKIDDRPVVVIGQQKGVGTREKIERNFGMPHPEGYRKAMRLMRLAEKFSRPVVCFIDTSGAYPGVGAEERGQATSIAENLRDMAGLEAPIIVVIIGEGGSGGALGIGVGDRVMMMQYSTYFVCTPEACASILWHDAVHAPEAAAALRPTAEDLLRFGVIDKIVPEPTGGAHRDPEGAAELLKKDILTVLGELSTCSKEELLSLRYEKFRSMGKIFDSSVITERFEKPVFEVEDSGRDQKNAAGEAGEAASSEETSRRE
ncbi:acetyl-CoA carboxylase carboxyltransferase subunit alpha [Candidatus Hydrogenedentota bacterium]